MRVPLFAACHVMKLAALSNFIQKKASDHSEVILPNMASGKAFCDQMLTTKRLPRPSMLLKDYLRDDLSSCSSGDFKSFPRRQCCTSVRFLVETDLQPTRNRRLFPLNKRRLSTKSALQKASEAIIKAVQLLSFTSMSAPPLSQRNKAKKGLLSRSLSRKLLSRSFWRKATKEEATSDNRPWRSFCEFLEGGDKLSDQNIKTFSITMNISNQTFGSGRISTSSSSGSNKGKCNSWAESEFTWEILRSSSGNWESSTENDAVESEEFTRKKRVGKRVSVTAGEESMDGATTTTTRSLTNSREWRNEEKEQFSPVSVLDCPFEDDEDITFPYNCTSNRLQGNKHKHVQKNRRHFNRMASLEPVDLQKRIALSELEDQPEKPPTKTCPELRISVQNDSNSLLRDEIAEEKARDLLNHVKRSMSPKFVTLKAENLLFDFFRHSIVENSNDSKKLQLCKVADDWINGQFEEQYLGWEVREGRQVYIREMDQCGSWRISNKEKEELLFEVEFEVFTALVNELLLDLSFC